MATPAATDLTPLREMLSGTLERVSGHMKMKLCFPSNQVAAMLIFKGLDAREGRFIRLP